MLILDIVMISLFDFQTMQKRFLTFKLTLLNIISIIGIIVFIVMLIYSLRIVYYLTNKFIDFMSCISIKSLKIAGNSLEKSNSTEMSFLDKDVETIIKLLKIYKKFIVNKDLIVVIEDIDRYESTELFLELYHISSICTNIKFIFPMNAELFSPIELSKYFNAIVDIIPFNDKVTLGKEIIKSLDKVSSKGAFKVNPSIVFKTLPFVSDLREAIRIENKYVTNIENHATVEANVLNEDSIGLRTKIYAYSFLETRFPKEVNNYSSDENLLKEIINEIEEKWEVWSASNIKKINYSRERYNEEKNESMKKYKELNEGKIRYNGDEEFIEDYYDKIINRYGGVLTYTKYLENPGMHINAYLSDEEYKEFEEKERNEIEKQKKNIRDNEKWLREAIIDLDNKDKLLRNNTINQKAVLLKENGQLESLKLEEKDSSQKKSKETIKKLEKDKIKMLIIELICNDLLDDKWEDIVLDNRNLDYNDKIEKRILRNVLNEKNEIIIEEKFEPSESFLENFTSNDFNNSSLCCYPIFKQLLKAEEYQKVNNVLNVYNKAVDEKVLTSFGKITKKEADKILDCEQITKGNKIKFYVNMCVLDPSEKNDSKFLSLLKQDEEHMYQYFDFIKKYIENASSVDDRVFEYLTRKGIVIEFEDLKSLPEVDYSLVKHAFFKPNLQNLIYISKNTWFDKQRRLKENVRKKLNIYEIIKDEELTEEEINILNENIYRHQVDELDKVLDILSPKIRNLNEVDISNVDKIISSDRFEKNNDNYKYLSAKYRKEISKQGKNL